MTHLFPNYYYNSFIIYCELIVNHSLQRTRMEKMTRRTKTARTRTRRTRTKRMTRRTRRRSNLNNSIVQDDHASWKTPREECYNKIFIFSFEILREKWKRLQFVPTISLSKNPVHLHDPQTDRPKLLKQKACILVGWFLNIILLAHQLPTWPPSEGFWHLLYRNNEKYAEPNYPMKVAFALRTSE